MVTGKSQQPTRDKKSKWDGYSERARYHTVSMGKKELFLLNNYRYLFVF